MSSLSERLAALNRTTVRPRTPSPRRTGSRRLPSGVPTYRTDAPATPDATPAKTAHVCPGHPRGQRRPPARRRPPAAPRATARPRAASGLGKAVGASTHQSRAAATTATRTDAAKDRFEDLKENVHTELLQQLGPQLYDANLDAAELEPRSAPSWPTCSPRPTGR